MPSTTPTLPTHLVRLLGNIRTDHRNQQQHGHRQHDFYSWRGAYFSIRRKDSLLEMLKM